MDIVKFCIQLEGSNETMIVNESQLLSDLFVKSDISQLKDAPNIGESIAANTSFNVMLKQDSEAKPQK